jgi:23S rRNA (pseudouridine1915-N3)-methyltransferase
MHLHLIFVGKTAFPDIDSAIQRYLERLKHYAAVEACLVRAEKIGKSLTEEMIRERESGRILDLVKNRGILAVWEQRGQELDSPGFARLIGRLQQQGTSHLWMVIGGPLGVSQTLLDKSDYTLALSRMTFPHDVARLLVLEQLYRAFTILKGEPYHK